MASFTVTAPEPFTFSTPSEWTQWIKRFTRFLSASGLAGKTEPEQINALVYLMGEQAEDILTSFKLSEADGKKYQKVVEAFENHFILKKNVIFERARFNSRVQSPGEPVVTFIEDLHRLAEKCEYGDLREDLIRDRIVVGVANGRLSEKMQLEPRLTLEKAVTMARQSEEVRRQQEELQSTNSSSVNRVHHNRKNQKPAVQQKQPSTTKNPNPTKKLQQSESKTCRWCGASKLHKKEECPAKDKKCNKCSKVGHYSKVCLSAADPQQQPKQKHLGVVFLGSITGNKQDKWNVQVTVGNIPVEFKIDSGADVTVIPYNEYLSKFKSKLPKLQKAKMKLFGPNKVKLETAGMFKAKLTYGTNTSIGEIFVVQDLEKSLLGLSECENLNIIKRINNVLQSSKVNPQKEFPEVFKGLGKLSTPCKIELKEGSKPFAVYSPRRVPLPLLSTLKEKLKSMEELGVISAIEEPTEWCAPIVLAPKAKGDIRLCVDLTQLNKCVKRERHVLPTVESTFGQLKQAKFFSKLDATSGFWQVPLENESKKLTTFITPFGRYYFNRLPFGITSAPEHFQRKMSQILENIPEVKVVADDILITGTTIEEHDKRLREVLQRLKCSKITVNEEKCEFGVTSIKYLGHLVDEQGIRADPDKIKAINNMPVPQDKSAVRRLMGMINHVGRFIPHLADLAKPLNELLKESKVFLWTSAQEKSFKSVKQILTSDPILAVFDPNRRTILQADASKYGLGAALFQLDENGQRRVVAYGSRTMTETEQRYGQVEKEALGIAWAAERFQEFIIGLSIIIETDHKPLIPIMNQKNLDELTPRLQRFRMKLMRFNFECIHVPGKEMFFADTLSRAPLDETQTTEEMDEEEQAFVNFIVSSLPASSSKLDQLKAAQQSDPIIQKIKQYINEGWPKESLTREEIKFYHVRDDLNEMDDLLLRGSRIVIPPSFRKEMMDRIHEGHFGITKCRERARESVWWPGISMDITEAVKTCLTCIQHQNHRREELIPSKFPQRPWQNVAMDLLKFQGRWYLSVYDYYSRFPEFALLENLTAKHTIIHLKSIFARHGVPELVRSDNGGQFEVTQTSEFQKFAKEYGFKHVTSSPKFPQSNGLAEAGVKVFKSLFKKNADPYKALLEYRSTPIHNGYSPAELLMNRKIRSTLPMIPQKFNPTLVPKDVIEDRESKRTAQQKFNYDNRHGGGEKEEIQPSDVVWLKDRKEWATVKEKVGPRSYVVETPEGRSIRRNTFHMEKSFRDSIPKQYEGTDLPEPEDEAEVLVPLQHKPEETVHPVPPPVQEPQKCSRYGRPYKPKKMFDL